MSVCFVSTDNGSNMVQIQDDGGGEGSSGGGGDVGVNEEGLEGGEAHVALEYFWKWVMEDIRTVAPESFKNQVLPLARVKKIMKLDEEVKMISAEAPLLFAKAAEIFIHELTLRAWAHTEDNKRRTLQRNDIAMAIIRSDQFDFLIDIVPRQEVKPCKVKEEGRAGASGGGQVSQDQVHYYFQLAQQHQAALQSSPGGSQQQQQQQQQQPPQQTTQPQPQTQTQPQPQQTMQILQQVVTPTGEIQQIPIQLTPSQMNMIRMQVQGGNGQPIIIQAAPIPTSQQHLLQVQPVQAQQMYLSVSQQDTE